MMDVPVPKPAGAAAKSAEEPSFSPGGYKGLIDRQDEGLSILRLNESQSPITVIGTQAIVDAFDENCLVQAVNSRLAPGVTELVLESRCTFRLWRTRGLRHGVANPYLSGAGGR